MAQLNHYAISSILGSQIIGRTKVAHGQIGSLQTAQNIIDLRSRLVSPAEIYHCEQVPQDLVIEAFRAVRQDRGSPDLHVADPQRNRAFLKKCRALGAEASDYTLNKALLNARKGGKLSGLASVRPHLEYEDYAFACELAAIESHYRIGASIDDIICDPELAARFDSIASRIAPGHSPFEYRWALIRIHKARTRSKWNSKLPLPRFKRPVPLLSDAVERIPSEVGVYLLSEGRKPLYARGTVDLKHGIETHRDPRLIQELVDQLWQLDPNNFLVSYATVPQRKLMRSLERLVIAEKKPILNVPRAA